MKIIPHVKNEFDNLAVVFLGRADDFGGLPKSPEDAYDPKSKEHILAGTFPEEDSLKKELKSFEQVLLKYGVKVLRPNNKKGLNQIFARDIAFVVDDKFIEANMISDRADEFNEIVPELRKYGILDRIKAPDYVSFEGGDVMPHNDVIFIGFEKEPDFSSFKVSRTNEQGVEFIKKLFPEKKIIACELNKSDDNPRENALHLDCCFQPLGLGHCLIYKGGFKHEKDYFKLVDSMGGPANCIDISQEEMYEMGSNVFSIRKDVVVSNAGQTRINNLLREKGYTVEEVDYHETSKMGGLFRCSTLPILRK